MFKVFLAESIREAMPGTESTTDARSQPLEPNRYAALGRALHERVGGVADEVARSWLVRQSAVGEAEGVVAEAMVEDCIRSTQLVARWLVTGQAPTKADTSSIADRAGSTIDGTLSTADLVRSYLVWRDIVLKVLAEEACRLGTPVETLATAEAGVRQACDAGLMMVVKEHDAARLALQHQLDKQHAELQHLAQHDPLTGLHNRAVLLERLTHALAGRQDRRDRIAVLFLDLDGFKSVNDRWGHDCGDQLLVEVAERLRALVRPSDTVARYGGDEFVILCEDVEGGDLGLAALVSRVREGTQVEAAANGGIAVSVSVGAVLARADIYPEALVRAADDAMYAAKRRTYAPR